MALWQVVGGAEEDGIVVREGRDPESPALPKRLCAGAVVRELELAGRCLRYEVVWRTARERKQSQFRFLAERMGEEVFGPAPAEPETGPVTGWVTLRMNGRDLLVPFAEPACHMRPTFHEHPKAWSAEDCEGFTQTVHMLSGRTLQIAGLHPKMPLAALSERIAAELELMDGQELQLVAGTQLLAPADHGRTLQDLGLDGRISLTCIQRTVLQPGDVVVVDGLVSAMELNGVTGICERWIPAKGRWRVQLSATKAMKPSELLLVPPGRALQPGVDVAVRRPARAPELAGAEGACARWVRADLVQVSLVLSRNIRPQNLHLVSHELAPKVAATMLRDVDSWSDRDAQPAAGVNAALGAAFATCGHPSSVPFVANSQSWRPLEEDGPAGAQSAASALSSVPTGDAVEENWGEPSLTGGELAA